ncbi:putative porin [Rheinheimera pacifica]|uniref:outer membrane beta-barrel protein n=1 Tax=Rheinheimera pacifica TaxID=173990 RepID=UPI00285DB02D|nr:outer membrane beta-barrel protein [Rheinheimera pacifica]MDR6982882.1 putative porin [Rheinheimera pacifica]
MKSIIAGLALTALGCSAFTVKANTSNIGWKQAAKSDINWNYVGAGYAKATIKNIGPDDIDLDGYQLNARYLLSDNLYLHASYYDVSGDVGVADIELEASELVVGLGLRQAVAKNIDSFIEAGYVRSEMEVVSFEKRTFNGFQASAGFRYLVIQDLELSAALRYNDSSGSDSSTFGDISARYRVTPMIDLYINYQFDSDASLLGTGIALNF